MSAEVEQNYSRVTVWSPEVVSVHWCRNHGLGHFICPYRGGCLNYFLVWKEKDITYCGLCYGVLSRGSMHPTKLIDTIKIGLTKTHLSLLFVFYLFSYLFSARSVGRPKLRWEDGVDQYMRILGVKN